MSAYYNEYDPYAAEWLRNLIAAGHIAPGDVDERSIEDVRGEDLRGYDQVHLFAGIGGWSLALRMAGWGDDRPVWTGSAPCQPFSVAGRRGGTTDARHLWPEMRRLIAECRPEVVFGEQVASSEVVGSQLEVSFVVAVQEGRYAQANRIAHQLARSASFHYWRRWVDGVCADLEADDYSVWPAILGAHSATAPHIRQRLWWVADAGGQRRQQVPGSALGDEAAHGGAGRDGCEPDGDHQLERACQGAGGGLGDAGNEGLERRAGQRGDDGTQLATAERAGSYWGNTWLACSDGTARRVVAGVPPLAHGLPRRVDELRSRLERMGVVPDGDVGAILKAARRCRKGVLKGMGNAIVPQVASEFIKAYMDTLP